MILNTFVRLLSLLPLGILTIWKPKEVNRHKISIYTTLFGLYYGYDIKSINFILNQIMLESAYGKSNLTKTINNCIGMRCVSVRPTTQSGCFSTINNGSFGMYTDLLNCVKDRYLWGKYFNENQYFDYLKATAGNIYCQEEDYVNKIEAMPNQEWCIWLIITSLPLSIITFYLSFVTLFKRKTKRKYKRR